MYMYGRGSRYVYVTFEKGNACSDDPIERCVCEDLLFDFSLLRRGAGINGRGRAGEKEYRVGVRGITIHIREIYLSLHIVIVGNEIRLYFYRKLKMKLTNTHKYLYSSRPFSTTEGSSFLLVRVKPSKL